MAAFGSFLFWGMIAFTMMVAAAYVGTTIALRRYFDDERFNPSDVIAVEDDRGER